MKFRGALLAASIVALPTLAQAEPVKGFYVGAAAGFNLMPNEQATATALGTSSTGEVATEIGPAFSLSLGWGFGNGLRMEIQGDHRSNGLTGESGFSGVSGASGTERKYGVMVNALYDFDVAPWVSPYLGVGIGYQFVHEPGASATSGPAIITVNGGTKGSFAYQAIGGLAFPMASVPGLSLTSEYRFMGLSGDRTYTGAVTVPGVGSFPLTDKSSNDYNHTFLFGIRYAFGPTR